jgi:Fructose-1,6-bisphosphatase
MKSNTRKTLDEFIIERQEDFKYSTGELSRLLNSILLAGRVISYNVNKAGLIDIFGTVGTTNVQGEEQKKLDVYANDVFIQTLVNREIVCGIASEENDNFITIQGLDEGHNNKYVVNLIAGGIYFYPLLPNRQEEALPMGKTAYWNCSRPSCINELHSTAEVQIW